MIEFTKDEAILMYKSIHPEAYALSASFSDDDLEKNRVTAVDVDTVTYEDFDYVLRDLFNNCVEKKYIIITRLVCCCVPSAVNCCSTFRNMGTLGILPYLD